MTLDVDPIAVSGSWWRQVRSEIDPIALPTPPPDARWQRGSCVGALYLAESADTAWAEWYRWVSEAALPPRAALPRDLARIAVEEVEVADLSTVEQLNRVELDSPKPSSRDWPRFQGVGEAVLEQGFAGLLAPSSARDSGLVLCLFQTVNAAPVVNVEQVAQFAVPPTVPRGLRT